MLKLIGLNIFWFIAFSSFSYLFISMSFFYINSSYEVTNYPFELNKLSKINPPKSFPISNITDYNTTIGFSKNIPLKYVNEDKIEEYNLIHKKNNIGSRINLFSKKSNSHLLLVGDSQTFGVGVKDDEVYSNVLARRLLGKDINVYNMGFQGWGPAANFMFFDEKVSNLKKYVKEPRGTLIYLFYPELSERDVGTSKVFEYLHGGLPYYELDDEELILRGKFKDEFRFSFDLLMAKLNLGSKWDEIKREYLPEKYNRVSFEYMYNKTAKILNRMKRNYTRLYPGSRFVVFICEYRGGIDKKVNEIFDKNDVPYIDLRGRGACIDSKKYYYSENHLNKYGHEYIADKIQETALREIFK